MKGRGGRYLPSVCSCRLQGMDEKMEFLSKQGSSVLTEEEIERGSPEIFTDLVS